MTKISKWHINSALQRIINIQKKGFHLTFKKNISEFVFKEFLSDAEYYIVLDEDGTELGWICISYQRWNNTARMWDINVLEENRRNGIGKKLLEFGWYKEDIILEFKKKIDNLEV